MNDTTSHPDPGTTGSNTISRAELAAYFKRRGHDHGADAAAAVFDNIRAHRGPETGPAEADRSALAGAERDRIIDLLQAHADREQEASDAFPADPGLIGAARAARVAVLIAKGEIGGEGLMP